MAKRRSQSEEDEKARLIDLIVEHDDAGYPSESGFRKTHREGLEKLNVEQLKKMLAHYEDESITN